MINTFLQSVGQNARHANGHARDWWRETGETRLAALPLPRACIALTKSEEKEGLLAVYRLYDGLGDTNLPPTPSYNSSQGGSRDPPLVGLLLSKQPTIFRWWKRHDNILAVKAIVEKPTF